MSNPSNQKGKIIIITGAASGMGFALATAYTSRNDTVIACDINQTALDQCAEKAGVNYKPTKLDVTDHQAWEQLVESIMKQYGKIDAVYNNAGIMSSGSFEDLTVESWQAVININLMGVIYGSRACYKVMQKQGFGTIVNISSTAGVTPVLYSSSYAASKHAIVGFSNSLRLEAKSSGIDVIVVMPGLVDTNIFEAAIDGGDKSTKTMSEQVPVKKIPASEAAKYIITGVEKGQSQVVFPFINRLIIFLYRLFPKTMSTLIAKNQKHS